MTSVAFSVLEQSLCRTQNSAARNYSLEQRHAFPHGSRRCAVVLLVRRSTQAATVQTPRIVNATVNIGMPTEIAGTTLQPGKYTVKISAASDDSSDPTVEFSEMVYDPYVQEGLSPYVPEVVLTVQSATQDLGAPAANTGLITSEDSNSASALEIRGSSTEYVFGTTTASAANNQ